MIKWIAERYHNKHLSRIEIDMHKCSLKLYKHIANIAERSKKKPHIHIEMKY